jgi:hypothetical protein
MQTALSLSHLPFGSSTMILYEIHQSRKLMDRVFVK